MPLFFWFDRSLGARAEICQNFSLVFWKISDTKILFWNYLTFSCAAWNVFPVNLLLLRSLFRARKSKCNFLKANLLYIFDARRPWPWFLGVLSTTLGLNAFRKEDCYFHQTFTWTAIKFRYCEKKYHTVFLNYLKVRKSQKQFFLEIPLPKKHMEFLKDFFFSL